MKKIRLPEHFISRLILLREQTNLKQYKFAEKIGKSKSYLSEIESGKKNPGVDFLIAIKNSFPQVNLEWLFTGQGEMFVSERQTVPVDPSLLKPLNQVAEILESGTSAASFLKGQIETALEMMQKDRELARIKREAAESPQTGTDNSGR